MSDSFSCAVGNGIPPSTDQRRRRGRRLPPGFLSVLQLEAVSPIGKSALYEAIRRRELPAFRWRNRLCVKAEDFQSWLSAEPLSLDDGGAADGAAEPAPEAADAG